MAFHTSEEPSRNSQVHPLFCVELPNQPTRRPTSGEPRLSKYIFSILKDNRRSKNKNHINIPKIPHHAIPAGCVFASLNQLLWAYSAAVRRPAASHSTIQKRCQEVKIILFKNRYSDSKSSDTQENNNKKKPHLLALSQEDRRLAVSPPRKPQPRSSATHVAGFEETNINSPKADFIGLY